MGKQAGSARPKEVGAAGPAWVASRGLPFCRRRRWRAGETPEEAASALTPPAWLFLAPCLLELTQPCLCGPPCPRLPVSPAPY